MKYIEVVTRYGSKHLAHNPTWPSTYNMKGRHFTLCMGTSSWTVESWEEEPDHPLLTIEEIRALEMNCETCKKLAILTA
jgi:hypothetical protein